MQHGLSIPLTKKRQFGEVTSQGTFLCSTLAVLMLPLLRSLMKFFIFFGKEPARNTSEGFMWLTDFKLQDIFWQRPKGYCCKEAFLDNDRMVNYRLDSFLTSSSLRFLL